MGCKSMKKKILVGVTVVVEVENPWIFAKKGDEQLARRWNSRAEDVVSEIRRHVDGIDDMRIQMEHEETCEHCGSDWTEGPQSLHNGGCCWRDCAVLDLVDGHGDLSRIEDLAYDYWSVPTIQTDPTLSALSALNVLSMEATAWPST